MEKIIYSKSFTDFLKKSECKIAILLYRLSKKNYTPLLITSKEINYLTFRTDGTISFLPDGKELIYNDNGEWSKENRQNGKPSKIIRKLFTDRAIKLLQIKDADFECFTNSYKAEFNEDGYKLNLCENTEIAHIYDMDIKDGSGSLNNSCMNGDSEYLDIYRNCKQLNILVLKNNDGLLCGRSLIWKINDEITIMDRIYVTDDFMYDKFLSYCSLQSWWRKKDFKSYDNKKTFINNLGEEVIKEFTVYTKTDFDSYPYIDTFQFGSSGELNNYEGEYTYNSTDGSREDESHEGEIYCESRGEYIDEGDAIYLENGERRYRDEYHHVDDCVLVGDDWYHEDDNNIIEVNNEWHTKDDENICEIDGEYYLVDDCFYSEFTSEWHLSEDCVYSEEHGTYIIKCDAVEICGNIFHKDDIKELV